MTDAEAMDKIQEEMDVFRREFNAAVGHTDTQLRTLKNYVVDTSCILKLTGREG